MNHSIPEYFELSRRDAANAIVALPPWRGDGSGPRDASLRGAGRQRWPVEAMLAAGWAVMTSCHGSWGPDSPERWRDGGLVPLLDDSTRAISLWAWALQRMADAASQLGLGAIVLAGHSRLGKAALWAAANDTRVAAVLSNDAGCGGASLSRHAPSGSETLAVMRARFPHWLLPEQPLSVDQDQLLAAIAPRALYVASANDDAWADPGSEYLALAAAASAWASNCCRSDRSIGPAVNSRAARWAGTCAPAVTSSCPTTGPAFSASSTRCRSNAHQVLRIGTLE